MPVPMAGPYPHPLTHGHLQGGFYPPPGPGPGMGNPYLAYGPPVFYAPPPPPQMFAPPIYASHPYSHSALHAQPQGQGQGQGSLDSDSDFPPLA